MKINKSTIKKEGFALLSSYSAVMGKKKRLAKAVNVEIQQSLESGISRLR